MRKGNIQCIDKRYAARYAVCKRIGLRETICKRAMTSQKKLIEEYEALHHLHMAMMHRICHMATQRVAVKQNKASTMQFTRFNRSSCREEV